MSKHTAKGALGAKAMVSRGIQHGTACRMGQCCLSYSACPGQA